VRLLGEQLDHATELFLRADGELDRRHRVAKHGAGGRERPREIGVLAVHLVNEDHARNATFLGQPPGLLGADLDPGRGVDEDDGGVGNAQGGLHVADEIGIARRIDDVDLAISPLDGSQCGADGDLPFDLVRVIVGDGVPLLDLPETGRRLGIEEEGFRQ
jgi:hypothetical protein